MCGEDKKEIDKPEAIEEQNETGEDKTEDKEVEKTPEVENPQEILRGKCRSKCRKHVDQLDECNRRVLSRSETKEICFEELADLLHCVDHCVAHDLFKYLK